MHFLKSHMIKATRDLKPQKHIPYQLEFSSSNITINTVFVFYQFWYFIYSN
jgi:hypothetical protein